MFRSFLDKAYTKRDPTGTRGLYDEWSGCYDAEMDGNGYATPTRCAAALATFAKDLSLPLLDFGCGTGLSGQAFKAEGFQVIDGVDISPEMVAQAKAKEVYRSVTQIEPNARMPRDYALMSAVGVIGAGGAPIGTLDMLLRALPSGGLLVFSFNDHTLADRCSRARLNEWLDCGAARLLFAEHGPHLPERNINATVYVVDKA